MNKKKVCCFLFQGEGDLPDVTENLEGIWNPNLYVENALGDQQPDSSLEVVRGSDGSAFVVEKKTFEGTFSETMELRSFPFDIQVGYDVRSRL